MPKKIKTEKVSTLDDATIQEDSSNAIEDIKMYDFKGEEMVQMVSEVLNLAIDLSTLVVDNRKHNSEKMSDEDIYQIYNESFRAILLTSSNSK
jgi:hypothetical protein